MSFSGRSPFNDVVRSVLLGAAMISPAVLVACGNGTPAPQTPDPQNVTVPSATPTGTGPVAVQDPPPDPTASAPAPDNSVVRPRTPPAGTSQMPTRGFSGAGRRTRARV